MSNNVNTSSKVNNCGHGLFTNDPKIAVIKIKTNILRNYLQGERREIPLRIYV